MSSPKYLKESIENLKNTSPILIVGDAMTLFLSAWKYKTVSISNHKDLAEVIAYYSLVEPSTPLVIYDIVNVPKDKMPMLLKFIEDYKYPIILLGSYDNFDNILLSRIKTFIKFSSNKVTSEFLPTSDGLRVLSEKISPDMTHADKNKLYTKYCPKMYYIDKSLTIYKNKSKILDILC